MDINLWAVLTAGIVATIIGSIWYGPLFGKVFIQLMGMDKWSKEKQEAEKKKMGMTYGVQFLTSLVNFYALAWFMQELGQMSVTGGLFVAGVAWIGFVVPVKLGDALWGGNMKLFWIGIGNMLVTLLAAGAIIGAWS